MGSGRLVIRLCPLVLLAAVVACQPEAPPKPTPMPVPSSAQDVSKVKMEFARRDPNARVGTVSAVRPQDTLAAVSDLSLADIRPGDAVSFLDSGQNVVANGIINSIDTSGALLVVKYVAAKGGRAPGKGDAAVWFKPTP